MSSGPQWVADQLEMEEYRKKMADSNHRGTAVLGQSSYRIGQVLIEVDDLFKKLLKDDSLTVRQHRKIEEIQSKLREIEQ
jgi:hypothetical protein